MADLVSYLKARVPEGMSYPDAAQLCLRLYCTVEGVPQELSPLDKDRLGEAFAELARVGWVQQEGTWQASLYGVVLHTMTDKGHWVEVMAATFKKPYVVYFERGELLARQVGFLRAKSLP